MKLARPLLTLLLVAAAAQAQSSAPAGQQVPSTPPPNVQVELDLDLPVPSPQFMAQFNVPALKRGPLGVELPPQPPHIPDPKDGDAPTFYGEEIPSENDTIFYVIDRSGSMSWGYGSYVGMDGSVKSGPKMDRAKAEIIRSILGLSQNFKFNIVAFDCATQLWRNGLSPADDANKQAAIAWVQNLVPFGATATGPAAALALGDKENMSVVLLTDGAPNCGANGFSGHRTMISSNNSQGARINVFGIGASGEYRTFCQGVAADSGGGYYDVP